MLTDEYLTPESKANTISVSAKYAVRPSLSLSLPRWLPRARSQRGDAGTVAVIRSPWAFRPWFRQRAS